MSLVLPDTEAIQTIVSSPSKSTTSTSTASTTISTLSTSISTTTKELSTSLSTSTTQAYAATKQAYNYTSHSVYSLLDNLSLSSTSSTTTPPKQKLSSQTTAITQFVNNIINILFNHTTFVKNETARFLQLYRFTERRFIFPVDRRTFHYLTQVRHINAHNKKLITTQQSPKVETAQVVIFPTLIRETPSQAQYTLPHQNNVPIDPATSPSSSPSSLPPPAPIKEEQLPLPTQPILSFSHQKPSFDAKEILPNAITIKNPLVIQSPILQSNGKGSGDLLAFLSHTVERMKEATHTTTHENEQENLPKPNLDQYKTNLKSLQTELSTLSHHVSSIQVCLLMID